MKIKIFDKEKEFIEANINFVLDVQKEFLDIAHIGLSGGKTPEKTYQMMAKDKNIDFSNIEFYLIDERFVPLDNEISNYRMVNNSLFKKIKKKVKGIHYFDTSKQICNAIKIYEEEIKKIPNHQFDLCILGIGVDGHIGGLFPSQIDQHTNELIQYTQTEIYLGKERLTLTLPVIEKSKKILILLQGSLKKEILDKFCKSNINPINFPARYLADHPNLTVHYCKE